jgi:hypothetical protein
LSPMKMAESYCALLRASWRQSRRNLSMFGCEETMAGCVASAGPSCLKSRISKLGVDRGFSYGLHCRIVAISGVVDCSCSDLCSTAGDSWCLAMRIFCGQPTFGRPLAKSTPKKAAMGERGCQGSRRWDALEAGREFRCSGLALSGLGMPSAGPTGLVGFCWPTAKPLYHLVGRELVTARLPLCH